MSSASEAIKNERTFPVLVYFQSKWQKGFAELFQIPEGSRSAKTVFLSVRPAILERPREEEAELSATVQRALRQGRAGRYNNFPLLDRNISLGHLQVTPRAASCPLSRGLREELGLDVLGGDQLTYTSHGATPGGHGLQERWSTSPGTATAQDSGAATPSNNSGAFLLPVTSMPLLLDVNVSGLAERELYFNSLSSSVKAPQAKTRRASPPKQRKVFSYRKMISSFFTPSKKVPHSPVTPVGGGGKKAFPSKANAARRRSAGAEPAPAPADDDDEEESTDASSHDGEAGGNSRRAADPNPAPSANADASSGAEAGVRLSKARSTADFVESAARASLDLPTAIILHFFNEDELLLFLHHYVSVTGMKDASTDDEGFAVSEQSPGYADTRWCAYVQYRQDPVNGLPFARIPLYLWHSFLPMARFVLYSCDRGYLTIDAAPPGSGSPPPVRFAVPDNEDCKSWRAAKLVLFHESDHHAGRRASAHGPGAPTPVAELDADVARYSDVFLCISESYLLFLNSFGEMKAHLPLDKVTHVLHSAFHEVDEDGNPRGSPAALSFPFITFGISAGDDEELEPPLLLTLTFLPPDGSTKDLEAYALARRQTATVRLLRTLLYSTADYTWTEFARHRAQQPTSPLRLPAGAAAGRVPTAVVTVTADDIYDCFAFDPHALEAGRSTAPGTLTLGDSGNTTGAATTDEEVRVLSSSPGGPLLTPRVPVPSEPACEKPSGGDVEFSLRMARQPAPYLMEKDALFLEPLSSPNADLRSPLLKASTSVQFEAYRPTRSNE